VQLMSGANPRSADLFTQKPSVATLSYKGGGRASGGEIPFDLAEAREAEAAARTAERLANPGMAGAASGVTFLLNGVPVDVPPPSSPKAGAPVRVGGNIRMPRRIVDAAPVMPEVARQAGIRGVVILEIVIGTDGRVTDVKVLRSVQLLDQAAIDTAYQWRYEPTLLNGAPVPVIMTATVNFQ
jgi:periplasmic protein TonB